MLVYRSININVGSKTHIGNQFYVFPFERDPDLKLFFYLQRCRNSCSNRSASLGGYITFIVRKFTFLVRKLVSDANLIGIFTEELLSF